MRIVASRTSLRTLSLRSDIHSGASPMRTLTLSRFIMLLLLAAGCNSVLAQNAVTDWSAIAEKTATANRPPASAEVLLGIVHVAMYDAVMAIAPGYQPFTNAEKASPEA